MLIRIPGVLTTEQVAEARDLLLEAQWADGGVTAGYQSGRAKDNLQLPEDSPAAKYLGEMILTALSDNGRFVSAALPAKIFPPLFNCYQGGGAFGTHVDNAIRHVRGAPVRIRTDVSMTLFLSDPSDYDGGELVIEDTYGEHAVRLPAGDMILYPGTSLHRVTPVTRGRRLASFFWLQSMVRSDEQRRILFELDTAIQRLNGALPDSADLVRLTNVYHNLVRQWAATG